MNRHLPQHGGRRRLLGLLVAALATMLVVGGCAEQAWQPGANRWTIATTGFTESILLGQLFAQTLNANGVETRTKELTTRDVVMPALEQGTVQIAPEYLSSATEYLNLQINGPGAPQVSSGDVQATFQIAQQLAAQQNLTVLAPAAAQDQNAFAVSAEFSQQHNITTLSQLAQYSQNNPVTLGASPVCPTRMSCQLGLEQVYNMKVGSFVPLDAGGPLTIQAINQGRIDVGVVFTSSGTLASNSFVVLADDLQLQNAENIIAMIYTPAATSEVTSSLTRLLATLSTEDLQEMNQQVDIYRKNPRLVAQDYLVDQGLIPAPK